MQELIQGYFSFMLRTFIYAEQNFLFAISALVCDLFYSNCYTHESTCLIIKDFKVYLSIRLRIHLPLNETNYQLPFYIMLTAKFYKYFL